jgi:hypothetical protein
MIGELLRGCKIKENLLVPVVLSIVCVLSSAVFILFLHSFDNEFGISIFIIRYQIQIFEHPVFQNKVKLLRVLFREDILLLLLTGFESAFQICIRK